MWVRDLVPAAVDASCGGKAVNLAALAAAGLPVPQGIVLDDRAFRALAGIAEGVALDGIGHALGEAAARIAGAEIPRDLHDEVCARVAGLGDAIIVRSSCSIEDAAGGGAAGVFQSVAEDRARVWAAIRAVWASALTPMAIAYARGRPFAVGAVIQARVRGEVATIYTRPPDDAGGGDVWIQRGTAIAKVARAEIDAGPAMLALRAEAAIGAAATGADVELVGAWCVQVRPIVRRARTRAAVPERVAPPPVMLAGAVADGRTWTLDVGHNPSPLSPAQAWLVERVERAGVAPWHMRVVCGYLYTTPRDLAPAAIDPAVLADPIALEARVADIEQRLAATLAEPDAGAIDRYVRFYAIWATELSPLVGAALRSRAPADLIAHRPSRIRALLEAAARGAIDDAQLRREIGDLAPAWDVAAPTYAETWATTVVPAIARVGALASPLRDPAVGALDRAIADLAERDDLWFYRAQAMVRRALLARARAAGLDPDAIFFLPLDADLADPIAAHRAAAGAAAATARAERWRMPHIIGAPPPATAPTTAASTTAASTIATSTTAAREPLRGRGIGPRVRGRVVRFDPHASDLVRAPTDVLVCRTVTPALAIVAIGAAAIVSESPHVGLLDHAIALARELDITCVVDCHDAWSSLSDGQWVTVDGASGTVVIDQDD